MKNILMQKLFGYLGQWLFSRSTREFKGRTPIAETKKSGKFSAAQKHLPKVVRFLKKRLR